MSTEVRWRRSFGSVEWQVAQSQPIIGTPCEVPVPRNVIFKIERQCVRRKSGAMALAQRMREGYRLWVNDALVAFLGLDEAHPKLVQEIVDELRFRVEKV